MLKKANNNAIDFRLPISSWKKYNPTNVTIIFENKFQEIFKIDILTACVSP